ncbi:MAG: putative toxin-antitoxin system toxin component, PIN family [Saprospiraceae bacterium]
MTRKYGQQIARDFLKALDELPNTVLIDPRFQWNLLADPDDNKFVDAAISSGASYIVSEDRDFRVLHRIDFPKVNLLRLADFKTIF